MRGAFSTKSFISKLKKYTNCGCLMLAGTLICSEFSYANPQIIGEVNSLIAEQRLNDAEQLLADAIIKEPTNIELRRAYVRILTGIGRYKDAEAVIVQILRSKPELINERFNLGRVYYHQNRYQDALALMKSLTHQLANYPENYELYGDIYLALAEQYYRASLGQTPGLKPYFNKAAVVGHIKDSVSDADFIERLLADTQGLENNGNLVASTNALPIPPIPVNSTANNIIEQTLDRPQTSIVNSNNNSGFDKARANAASTSATSFSVVSENKEQEVIYQGFISQSTPLPTPKVVINTRNNNNVEENLRGNAINISDTSNDKILANAKTVETTQVDTIEDQSNNVSPNAAQPAIDTEAQKNAEIIQFLESWVSAWTSRDTRQYFLHYSKTFKPTDGSTIEDWATRKKSIIDRAKNIKLYIEDIAVEHFSPTVSKVKFKQTYQSNSYRHVGYKNLDLKKINNVWLIIREYN